MVEWQSVDCAYWILAKTAMIHIIVVTIVMTVMKKTSVEPLGPNPLIAHCRGKEDANSYSSSVEVPSPVTLDQMLSTIANATIANTPARTYDHQ